MDLTRFSRYKLEPLREQDSGSWLYSRGDYTASFLHRAGRMDKAAESLKRDLRRSSVEDIDA